MDPLSALLLAMWIAGYFTRNVYQDAVFRARGEDPPSFRREMARWERRRAREERRGTGDGPGREFWRNVWGDAVSSAEERRERFAAQRAERRRARWADRDAAAAEDAAYEANARVDAAAAGEPDEPPVRTGRCHFCGGEFPTAALWPARDDEGATVDACHPCWHTRNRRQAPNQPEPEPADPETTIRCGDCEREVPFGDASLIYVDHVRRMVCDTCRLRRAQHDADERAKPAETTSVDPVVDDAGDAEVIQFADWRRTAASKTDKETDLSAEITGLQSAIAFATGSAAAADQAIAQTEMAIANLQAGGTSGDAITQLQQAMENLAATAATFRAAETTLQQQLQVREAYEANQGAGHREFVTSE
jgi:hypothetical protein